MSATLAPSAPKINALESILAEQQASFAIGAPDYETRLDALDKLEALLRERQEEFVDAVSSDFGGRPREETLLLEVLPLIEEIRNARRHLRRWMLPRRVRPTWFLMPARAAVHHQPLGIVGIIGAWNYPLLLTLSPAIGALAAGNHVMIKPSELAPRTADLLVRLLAARFPPSYVTGVTGDATMAAAFSALPFDHLVFTGSTRVGRLVMRAASANLTPVTLELGGKSPAIVHASAPIDRTVERIVMGKLYNAGQTCVAPDYVLLPREQLGAFRDAAQRFAASVYPRLVQTTDYTRIIDESHWRRLEALVADARAGGAEVVTVNPAGERFTADNRVFPPTFVVAPSDDANVMQEEIFGPVLPLVPYDTLDDAIGYVNARPRPLALYYFDEDPERVRRVIDRTISGGVTVNDVVYHLGQDNLPFGGVGPSGMGHYHGVHGFERFSKKKGVMFQSRWSPLKLVRPPYGKRTRAIIERLLKF